MSLESNEVADQRATYSQTTLYEEHGRAIFGYLRLHTRSPEDAEDLLLEVFLAALEQDNLSALAHTEQLAWLRRVAHNKLLNTYRRASRHPQVALEAIVDTLLTEDSPEQSALQQEERRQLRTYLARLPALQQQILQLRYSDGLRCAEIALLLNKREAAIRKLLSRSVLSLRQIYQRSEGENRW